MIFEVFIVCIFLFLDFGFQRTEECFFVWYVPSKPQENYRTHALALRFCNVSKPGANCVKKGRSLQNGLERGFEVNRGVRRYFFFLLLLLPPPCLAWLAARRAWACFRCSTTRLATTSTCLTCWGVRNVASSVLKAAVLAFC